MIWITFVYGMASWILGLGVGFMWGRDNGLKRAFKIMKEQMDKAREDIKP